MHGRQPVRSPRKNPDVVGVHEGCGEDRAPFALERFEHGGDGAVERHPGRPAGLVIVPDSLTRTGETAGEIAAGVALQLRVAVEAELPGEAHNGRATGANATRQVRHRAESQ